jgi:hypothetical protein
MEWEVFNEENMLGLQGILIAYAIFFVIGIISVKAK